MEKKVAELFVEVLAAAGVERIYGVASDSLNGITDSVRARKGIEWVGVRNEKTAAFASGTEAPRRASWRSVRAVADRAICTLSMASICGK
jgi:TPP-dependent 2-oxoacid decarboxylase